MTASQASLRLARELNAASRVESTVNMPDDWELVNSGGSGPRPVSLSGLFAKWTPSPNSMHNQALVEYLKEDGNQPSAFGGRDSQAPHWGWYRSHGIAMLNVL